MATTGATGAASGAAGSGPALVHTVSQALDPAIIEGEAVYVLGIATDAYIEDGERIVSVQVRNVSGGWRRLLVPLACVAKAA